LSFRHPDVLVLGGGGVLGEAWMSAVLAGIEEASDFDSRDCERYVGTSAGSIVAAALAGGASPADRLGRIPEQPPVEGDDHAAARGAAGAGGRVIAAVGSLAGAAAAPAAALALRSTASGGALVRRAALARLPRGRMSLAGVGRGVVEIGTGWDGRLRIAAVDLGSGRRAVFGAPGAPDASVAQAVEASCAIPGVFRPVRIGGRDYVDGGVWSPTNMDACGAGRGDRVLCLNPTASLRPRIGDPAGALGPVSRTAAAAEALALRRHGADVTVVNPDRASSAAMGTNLMHAGPRERVVAAGVAQGRRLASAIAG
jgi:NTE family protein